jgi:hypothetical protein
MATKKQATGSKKNVKRSAQKIKDLRTNKSVTGGSTKLSKPTDPPSPD